MSKRYIKPTMTFEDFSLSESIAMGCELKSNHAQNECAYVEDNGVGIFTGDISACTIKVTDGDGGFCYHVPTADMNIFTS